MSSKGGIVVVAVFKKEACMMLENGRKKVRRVSISKQRQISIPKDFYDALGLEDKAIVEYIGNTIVIRPPVTDIDFSKQILEDLVKEGYEGDHLVKEFLCRKANVKSEM